MKSYNATLAFVLCLVSLQHAVSAQEIKLVVPNVLENVEGNVDVTPDELDLVFQNGLRIQTVYPASEFESLPSSYRWLVGNRARPDRNVTSQRTVEQTNWLIRISTTQKSPEDLSLVFDENIGPDELVVFDGPLTLTTDPIGLPRPFDYVIDYNTPFFYDPGQGNLLIDIVATGPAPFNGSDGHDNVYGPPTIASFDINSPTASRRFSATVQQFVFLPFSEPSEVGDFDGDRYLTVIDIQQLSNAIRNGETNAELDLTDDGMVNLADQELWVHELKHTWFGDANLDGEFNSADLVAIFAAGEYEDDVENNSGWAEGDWNADGEFDSGDLVAAFTDGGYEQGLRIATSAVPEPSSVILAVLGLFALARVRSGRHRTIVCGFQQVS
ncbi:MAG: hypothetical protein KDB27_12905 [Planctomycetales bacterium]|nr:hypothetical protein [Planctomycetales bacterium]